MDRSGAPFFGALHTLAVDDRCRWTGLSPRQFSTLHIQCVLDPTQCAVIVPATEVVVDRAARWQILRQSRPLAAGTEDIHHPVDHGPDIDRSLVATLLRRWNQRADQRPLLVRQVTRVTQPAAVIPRSVLLRPHRLAPANRSNPSESQQTPTIQDVPGWTLRLKGGAESHVGRNRLAPDPNVATSHAHRARLPG